MCIMQIDWFARLVLTTRPKQLANKYTKYEINVYLIDEIIILFVSMYVAQRLNFKIHMVENHRL